MKRVYRAALFTAIGLSALAANHCGSPNPLAPDLGVAVVNGGGGLENLDAGPVLPQSSVGTAAASGAGNPADASPGGGSDSGEAAVDSGGSDATAGGDSGASGGSNASGSGPAGSNASSSLNPPSSSAGGGGTQTAGGGDGGTGTDASAGSVTLTIVGPAHVMSLDWTLQGPDVYSGSVQAGGAQSIEWIIGGVQAADGYTLTLTGTDTSGEPCQGTSAPFDVQAGLETSIALTIACDAGNVSDPADVTTGSVIAQADVVVSDE